MKILTLNPLSTDAKTDNLQVVGAPDGASAQNDLTKISVGTVTNPYGHIDSTHVEDLSKFFGGYTQLNAVTYGGYPNHYGISRFQAQYGSGGNFAFVNDVTNFSAGEYAVILEGTNGYSPDLLLANFITMNETLPITGSGTLPVVASASPSVDLLPSNIGNNLNPVVNLSIPWEDAPLATAQKVIPDFFTTTNCYTYQPDNPWPQSYTQTTNGSNVVSITSSGGVVPGLAVTGPYVPANTTITASSNIATLTGATSSLSTSTASPSLTYAVSSFSAGIPFAIGDLATISGASPSVYNATSLSVTATTASSFTVADPHGYNLQSITGNGSQAFFTFYAALDTSFAIGQNILTNNTGVTAFNFTTPQPIISYSVSGSVVTVGVASTATGIYVSGGYISSSCQTWVASNAIATDTNQITMSQNATGSGSIFLPNNVVTFTNGDAGSLVAGQVITDKSNCYVGIVSSVDTSGYFVTLVGNSSRTISGDSIFTCSIMSNTDLTNSGSMKVNYYDTKSNNLVVTSAKTPVYGAIANYTVTGLPASGVSGDGTTVTYTTPPGSPPAITFNNYFAGQYVTVSGFSPTGYNLSGFLTGVGSNTFSIAGTATAAVTGTGTAIANGITYYSANTFSVGQSVSVTGLSSTAFNISGFITATSASTFQIASAVAAGTTATGNGLASPTALFSTPTLTTASITSASSIANTSVTYSSANSFTAGQVVSVTGFTTTATAYNLTGVVIASATPTTFTVSASNVTFSGSASATATATLNSAVYDENGVLVGYSSGASYGSTFNTLISNPSVAFNIASTGLNGSATATTEIVAGQRVFPVNVYDPELSPTAYSTSSFTNSAAGLLPGMWFGGLYNAGTTIIPPCLITFVDYTNNTITLASAAASNFSTDVSGQSAVSPTYTVFATTNTASSTLYNRVVTGTVGFSLTSSVSSINSTTYTATATTSSAHGFAVGMPVTIQGSSNTNHNITAIIQSVPLTTQFTYNLVVSTAASSTATGMNASSAGIDRNSNSSNSISGATITNNADGSSTVVFTTTLNALNAGQYVAITGCYQQAFNAQAIQILVTTASSFTAYYPSAPITGYTTSGSKTVVITNFNNNEAYPGMTLTGSGIPSGTTIVSVTGNLMTISLAATATAQVTLYPQLPTTFDVADSYLASAQALPSLMPYSANTVTDSEYLTGYALVNGVSNSVSVAIPATANGTQYVSVSGQTPYNVNIGDVVIGTNVPVGTQVVATNSYTTGTVTTASATASSGTVTYNIAYGYQQFVPGQTVSISGNTGSNTNNTAAYDLTNAYVTAASVNSFTVIDPTVTTVTSVAVGGTATGTRTLTYTVPAHNFQVNEWVTTTGITSTATANQATMNATFQIASVTPTTIVRSGTVALASTAAGTGGYMTAVIGTVTSGNGGTASSEQVLQLSNNVTAGSTTLNIYTESSVSTGWSPSTFSFGILSSSATATGIVPITSYTPTDLSNTVSLNGGNYTLFSATNAGNVTPETVFYNSSPASWKNQAYISTTLGNKFYANITGVPSITTPVQITSLQSTPVAQVTQGSTSATVYVTDTSGFTIGNKYMIQNFIVTVTGLNALTNTITVSPAFSSGTPLVLSNSPYPNGDATLNNIYAYESPVGNVGGSYIQAGSFLNFTTFDGTGNGSFYTTSPITRYHISGMSVGSYYPGNRYFGSNTNQDFEKTYITPPSLGSHVGTTLNQPISAQLDTQFIVNPALTTFSSYAVASGGGYVTVANRNFIDLTLGAAGGNSVRSNYVVIIGSGTAQEAVLLSGQYQTVDNSDVSQGNSGPVAWKLAPGQTFQYDHLAGEPVVTPNVNLGQASVLGDVIYPITTVASSTPSVGYVTYTTTQPHNLSVGSLVAISNFTPTGYNTTGATVRTVPSSTTFSIANATTDPVSAYGAMTSENVKIVSGLSNLEVGQPIYSLYGNIPTGTTVTSILPDTGSTTSGLVGISQLAVNNQQTIVGVTGAVLGSDNASVVYTANNSLVTGQALNVTATAQIAGGGNVSWSANNTSVISATPTSFSTTLPSPSPFTPFSLTKIVPNGRNITITGATYASATKTTTYRYTLPFPGYNLQAGWYVAISGMLPASYNGTPRIATVASLTGASGTFTTTGSAMSSASATHAGTAYTSNMSAAAYYVASGTFTVGQTVNVSGVTPSIWNGTFTVAATGSNYFVVTYPSPASGVTNQATVSSTTGVAAVTFTSVTGGATSINDPLGTGFTYSHSANTPVLGGSDFGDITTLGYAASPSVVGTNPSKVENSVVELHTELNQPWLTTGNNGTANISTTLSNSASAGDTSVSIYSNNGFLSAYPTFTQYGVPFLPPKIGRTNGVVASGSIAIPCVVADQTPNTAPFSVTLGSETVWVRGSVTTNGVTYLPTFQFTGTTASGSASTISGITASAFNYLATGQGVVGSGIPAGATIATITASANSITISTPATGFGTFTFNLATASAHGDLTPVQLTAMPTNLNYTTLEVPYVWVLQDLAVGASYSSIATTPLAVNLPAGTTLYLQSGNYGQTVTLSVAALAGSTSLSVNTFTAQYAYVATVGSAGVITSAATYLTTGTGAYFTHNQVLVMSQNNVYQQLTVARSVSQNTQSVAFEGFVPSYAFDKTALVFAPPPISLDNGDALETVYPVTVPASQSGDGYSGPFTVTLLSPLLNNHAQGATFQYWAWPPNPNTGDIAYRPDLDEFFMYDGVDWRLSRILGVQGVYGLLGATNG